PEEEVWPPPPPVAPPPPPPEEPLLDPPLPPPEPAKGSVYWLSPAPFWASATGAGTIRRTASAARALRRTVDIVAKCSGTVRAALVPCRAVEDPGPPRAP